ncbi:MAG: hypothetical protein D6788_07995 [Planctomycetota bacterium]|nr:MAG: hypothetical protein D6788_07995 [Planctomycetota bacterium]
MLEEARARVELRWTTDGNQRWDIRLPEDRADGPRDLGGIPFASTPGGTILSPHTALLPFLIAPA